MIRPLPQSSIDLFRNFVCIGICVYWYLPFAYGILLMAYCPLPIAFRPRPSANPFIYFISSYPSPFHFSSSKNIFTPQLKFIKMKRLKKISKWFGITLLLLVDILTVALAMKQNEKYNVLPGYKSFCRQQCHQPGKTPGV